MSGHSKWSTIKHKKAIVDAKRGNVFTKMAAAITVAVRTGGGVGDLNQNFSLRLAVLRARSVNMPRENIERAIHKGMGSGGGQQIEELILEAYAPHAAALIVTALSDSRNRTTSEIKNILEKGGGRLGEPGSVMYQFERVGEVRTTTSISEAQELMLIDLGAVDFTSLREGTGIYTTMGEMQQIVEYLERSGFADVTASLSWLPQVTVVLTTHDRIPVDALIATLQTHDDVQEVYANVAQ